LTSEPSPRSDREAQASLLRDGSFLRVCTGRVVSSLGDHFFTVAIAVWLLTQRDDGPIVLGAVFAVRTAVTTLLLLVGGVLTDRLPRRLLMVGSQVLLGATVATLAVIPRDAPLALILALFVLAGAGDAFFRPAYQTFLVDLAGPERLESANSISTLTVRAAGLFGPALGGVLVATMGVHVTLLVDAASFALSAALVVSARGIGDASRKKQPGGGRAFLREAREGVGLAWHTHWLRAVLLSDLSQVFVAVAPFLVLLPIVLVPRSPASYAIVLSAFAAGALLGAATPLWWKPRAVGRSALLAQALFALPLLALALDLPLVIIAAATAIGGYGADLGSVLFMTGVQRGVPREALGRVMALTEIGSVALLPAGFALAGVLVQVVGAQPLLLAGVAVIITATTAALLTPGVAHMAQARERLAHPRTSP
jgi:MFS family permease